MSEPRGAISAYLKGVEKRLRVALDDQPAEEFGKLVGVKPDGRPPNNCGQWFYAVHFEGCPSDDTGAQTNDMLLNVSVTITRRMNYSPKDRKGSQAASPEEILDQAIVVKDLIHQDEVTRKYANIEMGFTSAEAIAGRTATVNGWVEPLRYLRISGISEQSAEWVGGNTETQAEKDIFVLTIDFGRARLVKGIW